MVSVSNPVLPPQPKAGQTLRFEPCCECGKPIIDGYYGRYGDGGVCSKTCDILHMQEHKGELHDARV